jgi:predicted MarR family transcription regulator
MNSHSSLNGSEAGLTFRFAFRKWVIRCCAAAGLLLIHPQAMAAEVKPPTESERCVLVE